MVVRDRLSELQQNAKHIKPSDLEKSEAEEMKPLNKDKAMTSSQTDFFEALNETKADIDKVKENVDQIKSLQTKILRAVRKDEADVNRMNDLAESNKQLAKRIRNNLTQENDKVQRKLSPKKSLSPSKKKKLSSREEEDIRIRQTQINSQSKRFCDIWSDYLTLQNQYREDSKKNLVKQFKIKGNGSGLPSDEKMEEMLDEGNSNMFAASILDQTKMAQSDLLALQTRHGEFMKLEKQIEEVRDLFVDLANLVNQQGELVDNIAHNVERAGIDVEEGKNQLDKAKTLMEKNRKMKIIAASVVTVLLLILILVICNELGLFYSSGSSETVTIIKEIHHYHNITQVVHDNTLPDHSVDNSKPSDLDSSSSLTPPPVTEEPVILLPED